jgi:hypothetical protein
MGYELQQATDPHSGWTPVHEHLGTGEPAMIQLRLDTAPSAGGLLRLRAQPTPPPGEDATPRD